LGGATPRKIIELFFIKHQASSIKHQASSIKHQASSIIIKHHQSSIIKHQASSINNVSKTPSTPHVKPKTHSRGVHPPPRGLYAVQQQDMARIPRLENQEPIKLRTNLPAPAEMYLWVSERNVAQKDAPTCENSRH
jgi:hypothetical protein